MTHTTSSTAKVARDLPVGWLTVTGLLVLALLIVSLVGNAKLHKQEKAFQTKLAAVEKQHAEELEQALFSKATALAGAMQMISPDLLSSDGQKSAQPFFAELLKDKGIAYVAIIDQRGMATAATDLRLTREASAELFRLDRVRLMKTPSDGADIEAAGPILDRNGNKIGAVRVGLSKETAGKK